MYSIVIHTKGAEADQGTNIPTTQKLREFLCGLDYKPITHLEIIYYREIATTTGLLDVVPEPNGNGNNGEEPDDFIKQLNAL